MKRRKPSNAQLYSPRGNKWVAANTVPAAILGSDGHVCPSFAGTLLIVIWLPSLNMKNNYWLIRMDLVWWISILIKRIGILCAKIELVSRLVLVLSDYTVAIV